MQKIKQAIRAMDLMIFTQMCEQWLTPFCHSATLFAEQHDSYVVLMTNTKKLQHQFIKRVIF